MMEKILQITQIALLLTATLAVGSLAYDAHVLIVKLDADADAIRADCDKVDNSLAGAAQDATLTLSAAQATMNALTSKGALRKAIF